jgi:hypothetical protein
LSNFSVEQDGVNHFGVHDVRTPTAVSTKPKCSRLHRPTAGKDFR